MPTPVLQKCAKASENGEVLEVNKRQPNLKREKEPLKERETNVCSAFSSSEGKWRRMNGGSQTPSAGVWRVTYLA